MRAVGAFLLCCAHTTKDTRGTDADADAEQERVAAGGGDAAGEAVREHSADLHDRQQTNLKQTGPSIQGKVP